MRRAPHNGQEQQQRLMAYMTDEHTSDEEKGRIMLALYGHAFYYLLMTAAEAAWVAVTGVRVWRRREAGLAIALRTGLHKPTLAVLLAARLAYTVLRRAGLAELDRRASLRP
jgi:hypothetical protein